MAHPHHEEPLDQQPGHHPEHEQDKPDLDAFAERLGVPPADDDTDSESRDSTAGRSDDRSSEDPASSDETAGGTSPLGTVWSVAAGARDLAEPVARFVQSSVSRVVHSIDDRRTLVDRVDQLEAQVETLSARLDAVSRTGD